MVFDDRRLTLDVYDELLGVLMHGCVGEPIGLRLGFSRGGADSNFRCDNLEVFDSTGR